MTDGVRIAIVSSPRVGGTWLRLLLAHVYAIEEIGFSSPGWVDWDTLPHECVIHTHGHEQALARPLAEAGFLTVTMARHPFDVLISLLAYMSAIAESPEEQREDGYLPELVNADPTGEEFRSFATGPAGRDALSISAEWWPIADARVRYETLVAAPEQTLRTLVESLPFEPRRPLDAAVAATALPALREAHSNDYHFWQGRPGLWRALLPRDVAAPIADVHADVFTTLGYEVDADASLTRDEGARAWLTLSSRWHRESAARNRRRAQELAGRVSELEHERAQLAAALAELESRNAALAEGLERVASARIVRYTARPRAAYAALRRWFVRSPAT